MPANQSAAIAEAAIRGSPPEFPHLQPSEGGGGVSRERRAIASAREGLRLFGNIHPERTPPGFCQCFTRRPQFGHGVALVFSPASQARFAFPFLTRKHVGHAK